MNFTHPFMTDEQKEASIQLNNISRINALNTHNWELQQRVQMLTAENERLREALKPFATEGKYIQESAHDGDFHIDGFTVGDFRAARKALEEQ